MRPDDGMFPEINDRMRVIRRTAALRAFLPLGDRLPASALGRLVRLSYLAEAGFRKVTRRG